MSVRWSMPSLDNPGSAPKGNRGHEGDFDRGIACAIAHKHIVYASSVAMGKEITARSPAGEVMPDWPRPHVRDRAVS